MPVTVRKARGSGYDIVEKSSGRKVGHSTTKKKASVSAGKRNQAWHRKRGR